MPDLSYKMAPNASRGAPAFPYIFDADSAEWRPYRTTDIAAAAEISVSGLSVTVSGIDDLRQEQAQTNAYLRSISGSVQQANQPYSKASSNGIVQAFNGYSGRCIVSKIAGFSKTPLNPCYIQIFDNNSQTGFPVANFLVDSGNNFFYTFEGGVVFDNGITVASSADPFDAVSGQQDFFATVFYKPYTA